MKTLLNSRLSPTSFLPQPLPTILRVSPPRVSFPPPKFLPFQPIDQPPCLIPRSTAARDSATMDVQESSPRDPSISSSYRDSRLAMPNLTLLDAQGRVCTGPTQTRPLTEDQAFRVLDTILRSGSRVAFAVFCCFVVPFTCSGSIVRRGST